MDSLKQRIVDYVKTNQPVLRVKLAVAMGITLRALDRETTALKEHGYLFSKAGFGYFTSAEAYDEWRTGPGAEQLSIRGSKGGYSSAAIRYGNNQTYAARIAILLDDGREMSAADIADELGVPYHKISTAITNMVNTEELKHTGAVGHRVYSLGKAKKRVRRRAESVNVICQECRQSAAMQRVLAFYGRLEA